MYNAIYLRAQSLHLHDNLDFIKDNYGSERVLEPILRNIDNRYNILNNIPILVNRVNILNYKYHKDFKDILLHINSEILSAYKEMLKELKSYSEGKMRDNYFTVADITVISDTEEKIHFKLEKVDEIIPKLDNIITTLKTDIDNIKNL